MNHRASRLATLALLFGAALGCGSSGTARSWHLSPPVVRSVVASPPSHAGRKPSVSDAERVTSAAGLVEQALHARGIRFGTDGTTGSLYAFMRSRFPTVSADEVLARDVLFFDLGQGCGGHTAIVTSVNSSGRIGFREWRDGRVRRSYIDPRQPRARRDASGRILNTFLRIKLPDDPAGTRYFAGEMLCAVIRPR